MGEKRILKNNFLMKVSRYEKTDEESGLKLVDSKIVKTRAKDFEESMYFDRAEGIEHDIKVVSECPEKFQLNTVYIRADGKMAWVNVLKED